MTAGSALRVCSLPALALCLAAGCGGTAPPSPTADTPADGSTEAAVPTPDAARNTTPGADSGAVVDAPAVTADVPPVVDAAMDAAVPPDSVDFTPDMTPDGGPSMLDAEPPGMHVGGTARVATDSLNVRTGPGTTHPIVTAMPCGATVDLLAGPTTGWWNVRYMTSTGWSSGAYLVAASAFDPAVCTHPVTPPPDAGPAPDAGTPPGMPGEVAAIFTLARSGVGYSYYWGHGSWGTDGLNHGACSGSCPGCTHSGRYGADCSGFVAKVWQIPGPSPVTTDAHPYSTYSFNNATTHWSRVPRAGLHPADALTYNTGGAGHIMLFESGADPWGNIWTYEARGCATGIVHNLRVAGTAYVAIRREGL